MKRRLLVLFLTAAMLFSLQSCSFDSVSSLFGGAMLSALFAADDDTKDFDELSEYVRDNIDKLNSIPFEEIPDDVGSDEFDQFYRKGGEEEFIEQYLGSDTIVDGINRWKGGNIVDFSAGGAGNVVHSEYTGFYYSKDDKPYGVEFDSATMTEVEPGVFEYVEIEDWQYTRTERIMPNWFAYYEKYY